MSLWKDCPECDGKGESGYYAGGKNLPPACPTCHGKGKFPASLADALPGGWDQAIERMAAHWQGLVGADVTIERCRRWCAELLRAAAGEET